MIQFLNTPDDCNWLRETHLSDQEPPTFRSFVMVGNEDCPDKVQLYAESDPLNRDTPVAVYESNDSGDLERTD